MIEIISSLEEDWLPRVMTALAVDGVVVLTDVMRESECKVVLDAALDVQAIIRGEIGSDRLKNAGEIGVVRMPLKYSDAFITILDNDVVNHVVDQILGPSAICHLINAILLPPFMSDSPQLFQSQLHQDFPRFTGGVPLSLNSFFCLTDFRPSNGSTRFLQGSHQKKIDIKDHAALQQVCAPAGSVILFDSTIWHAGGCNSSAEVRAGVNVQWTHHWIKQQIDVVRYLGLGERARFSPRLQQRLGYNSQVVTSLQEFYVPADERIYRSGQG